MKKMKLATFGLGLALAGLAGAMSASASITISGSDFNNPALVSSYNGTYDSGGGGHMHLAYTDPNPDAVVGVRGPLGLLNNLSMSFDFSNPIGTGNAPFAAFGISDNSTWLADNHRLDVISENGNLLIGTSLVRVWDWTLNGGNGAAVPGMSGVTLNSILGTYGTWEVMRAYAYIGETGGPSSGSVDINSITLNTRSVIITSSPQSQFVLAGASANFSVTALGTGQLFYQWQFNGNPLSGQTNASLSLNNVQFTNAGNYSVVVSNAYGSVTSALATLKLLTDPANGNQSSQVSPLFCPLPVLGKDSLVLVTHGWEPLYYPLKVYYGDISWITNMADAIRAKAPSNWEVRTLDWTTVSQLPFPETVLLAGRIGGLIYGSDLSQQRQWKNVHLIGHSAGAGVIESIASVLKSAPYHPVIQETFLDPYTGKFLEGRNEYGANASWADNYFVVDLLTDYGGVVLGQSPDSTSGSLEWAYNVDVGGTLLAPVQLPVVYSSGIAGSTQAYIPTSPSPLHGTPIDFYLSTVSNTAPSCAAGYGFALSEEAAGSGNWPSHSRSNNPPFPLCASLSLSQNQQPVRSDSTFNITLLPYGASSSGVNLSGNGGASLNTFFIQSPPAPIPQGGNPPPGGDPTSTNIPAWLALGLTITNAVNFVQFDGSFTSTNAQGLLTVYWDTNQIGMVDERVADPGLQTYRFALPGTTAKGQYVLGFRLDSFTNVTSSITVTNVITGFVGLTQPIALAISIGTNGAPILQLTAASGYNYLLQSSTNLQNWTPTALLVNTNGTVLFPDLSWTNSNARFFRALLQ
jgi:hypothetical protein